MNERLGTGTIFFEGLVTLGHIVAVTLYFVVSRGGLISGKQTKCFAAPLAEQGYFVSENEGSLMRIITDF